jgi:putative tricarboxylic transport membrane protein
VPLFALGIPSNVVMAILMSSFVVHGVAPSPGFIAKNPALFYGIICSMYVGNVMLLILNLPLIRIWIKILEIPYRILFPLILLFCVIGAFSINYRTFDVIVMLVFGVLGYILRKADYEMTPLVMAFVLGPMFESSFRHTLIISNGNMNFIFTRPIALVCLAVSFLLVILAVIGRVRAFREKIVK